MNGPLDIIVENPQKEIMELNFAYQTLEIGYQRFWEFFNFAPDGYLVTDTQGIIQEVNQTFLSMLTITRTRVINKPISNFIPDLGHLDSGLQLNWFSGSQHLEVALQPEDCQPLYVSISIGPRNNASDKTIGLLWLIRDITERIKMEEALRKASAYTRSLFEASLDPLVTINLDGQITDVNKAMEKATGVSRDRLIGSDFHHYFTEPEKALTGYSRALTEGQIKDHPLTLLHVSGQTIDVALHASVYCDEMGKTCGVFVQRGILPNDRRR